MSELRTAETPDGPLGYRLMGAAALDPLLLVRPLGGSMALWGRFAEQLSRTFRVVIFDPRGVGASRGSSARASTRDMAKDALAVMDAAGVAAAHVFGISLGGMVATWVAADHAQRVRRLVLASTTPRGLDLRPRALERGTSLALCLGRRTAADVEACMATRVLSHHFREQHPEETRRIADIARRGAATRGTLLRFLAAAALHDGRDALDRIRAPALVLTGARDHLLGPEASRHLLPHLGTARFEVLGDAGHDLTLEKPGETADLVTDFCK